jgi:NADH:ubiquinone oxidoreductase subunit F (NADH-binding)
MADEMMISLKNAGKIRPDSIEDYLKAGGYAAFEKALKTDPAELNAELEKSGLRGRGGAGFPTGSKQKFTRLSCKDCPERYVVCNADEGEPGTFKDRAIMEQDPHLLIEGMLISAYIIGSNLGYIYIRGEYYRSHGLLAKAIRDARAAGLLGDRIRGTDFSFDINIHRGAGSYLCGEELTLLESLEGRRGNPRIKPPFPAEKGLFGKPTLVNNVETLSHLPFIILNGSEAYRKLGTAESPGTKIFCVSGHVARPGVYEKPMGITLRELLYDVCGGMKDGAAFGAALLGGAAGTFVDESMMNVPLAYETLKAKGATLGSGAVIIVQKGFPLKELLQSLLHFFKHESCGKCVPCRVGCGYLVALSEQLGKENGVLTQMCNEAEYMAKTSLCPLGQSPILPLRSALKYFNEELD